MARDQLLDRPVAVKVLFPQFAAEPSFVERFRREAQAAANLNHPSIVAVYDWGEHDNTYFIVMEYVEGRSLAEIIKTEGTLHHDRAAEIAADTAAALGFAHRNGTVHRDVKGGNILITPAGQVKVTDFGIARAFGGGDELTQTGSVMGTATYFSPEQAQGKVVDPRSDLYSLGVVLFEMVTGRPPFVGESPVAIAYKHVQEMPPRPTSLNPAIPKQLEVIIARLLAKNPDQRYPSAEEVRADLRRFREGQPLMAMGGAAAPAAAAAATPAHAVAEPVQNRAVIDATRAMPVTAAAAAPAAAVQHEEYYDPPRRNGLFLVALVVLILSLAGLFVYIAQQLDDSPDQTAGEMVDVPSVINETAEDATRILADANLVADPVFELNPDVEPGLVFKQAPGKGEQAEAGSSVVITVSQAADTVLLPDVVGQTEEEAKAILGGLGLRVTPKIEASDTVPEGVVISMTPDPNQDVNKETLVTITVSTGAAQVEVPELAGLPLDEASNQLGQRKLPSPDVRFEPSSEYEDGQVIRSDPPAGTPVSIDRRVTLYVSNGPETAQVPPVIGLTQGRPSRP
ncbi:MAG: Stk1 family PASTA domain-containing Ser/Thr kinase [Acidimicrobiales bacterium]